jgi:hypothetical protein
VRASAASQSCQCKGSGRDERFAAIWIAGAPRSRAPAPGLREPARESDVSFRRSATMGLPGGRAELTVGDQSVAGVQSSGLDPGGP